MKPGREASLLGLALFALYAAGACRTIYVGDSGELVAAVHTLGIPHPSGYPLYVLLGKAWTLLVPVGSIAWRMSLFSAAAAALAAAVLYWTLRAEMGLGRAASLVAALTFALAPSVWAEANVQRVYALNALFVAAATAALARWIRTDGDGPLRAAAFACGLGASNHTFMAVYAAAAAVFVVECRPAILRRVRLAAQLALVFAAGLLPYLYLPLRSRADPALDWGNPETPAALWHVVSRADFWGRRWIEGPADVVPIAWDWARSFALELGIVGLLLAVVGLSTVRAWRSPAVLAVLVMLGNVAALTVHGSRADIFIWHRYYVPTYLMAALPLALGAQAILSRWPRAALVLLAVPLALGALRFREQDRSRYRLAEDYSRTLLSTLPPGAHLAANDDNILFVLIYLRLVEHLRPDVDLVMEGVGGELPKLRFDPDMDPLFFTHHPNWSAQGLLTEPVGLAFQTIRAGRPVPLPRVPKEELDGESDPRVPKDYLTRNLIGYFHYMIGISHERRDWAHAEREFAKARAASPDNDVLFYNLGLIYRRNDRLAESLSSFERAAAINPRHLAGHGGASATEAAAAVREQIRLKAVSPAPPP